MASVWFRFLKTKPNFGSRTSLLILQPKQSENCHVGGGYREGDPVLEPSHAPEAEKIVGSVQ